MIGSFSDQVPSSWPAPECIVFADVLEHMVDPWDAVRRARAMLAPGGVLVVSIPNISHASILRGLKRGRFDYADYGILDRTHLRFFTRATAVDLVEQGGFEIEFVRHRFDGSVVAQVFDRLLHFDVRPKRRLPSALGRAVDARTIQFIIRAR
jgi:SAM-dependent methyltransferase